MQKSNDLPFYRSPLALWLILVTLSCNQGTGPSTLTEKEIADSKAKAEKGTTRREGKFFSLTKLDNRYYTLVLAGPADEKDSFVTLMPLDSLEISLLKKTGNNIILTYRNFYNPVRKRSEKIVRSMVPLYDSIPK
jgi:hypothetical protein